MRVPVYESKVRTQAIDAPKVGVAPTGLDDLAKGISQVGAVASNIGEDLYREKEKAKNTRIDGALDEYERERTRIGYNDDENKGERGIFNVNGADAFKDGRDRRAVDSLSGWAKKRAELETDPDVRAELEMKFREKNTFFERDVEKHTGAQREVAETVAFNSRVSSVVANVAGRSEEELDADVTDLERRVGKMATSPEDANDRGRKVRTAVYTTLLDDYMKRGLLDDAETLISKRKADLTPKAVEDAKEKIKDRRLDEGADMLAGQIVASATDADGKPNVEKMVVPDTIDNIDLKERTAKALSQKREQEDRRWNVAKKDAFDGALSAYLQNKSNGLVAAAGPGGDRKRWMLKHDPKAWESIEKRWRDDIEYWKRLRAEPRGGKDGTPEGETIALDNLRRDMLENGERYKDISADELIQNYGKELGSQTKAGVKLLGDFRDRVAKDPAYLVKVGRVVSTAKAAARNFESRKKGASKMEVAEINSFLTEWVDAKIASGEIPTGEELTVEADRYIETRLGGKNFPTQPNKRPSLMVRRDEPAPVVDTPAPAPVRPSDTTGDPMLDDALGVAPKKSKAERIRELAASGMKREDIKATLDSEGY